MNVPPPFDNAGAADSVNHQRLMRAGLAVQAREHRHQKKNGDQHQKAGDHDNISGDVHRLLSKNFSPLSSSQRRT